MMEFQLRENTTMPNEIIQIIISGFFSLAGAGFGAWSASRLTNYRLEQLEKKVDKLANTEQRLALLEQKIENYEKKTN